MHICHESFTKATGGRVRITANTLAMEGTFIMKARRIIVSTLVTLALGCCVVGLGACASGGTSSNGANGEGGAPLTVAAMKGPTAIGMAHLMQEQDALADDGKKPAYEFMVAATADELVPRVAAGEFDIACVPANLAAKLYKQTNGGIRVIGINTLGVLYGISYDGGIQNLDGLDGRTVSTPPARARFRATPSSICWTRPGFPIASRSNTSPSPPRHSPASTPTARPSPSYPSPSRPPRLPRTPSSPACST